MEVVREYLGKRVLGISKDDSFYIQTSGQLSFPMTACSFEHTALTSDTGLNAHGPWRTPNSLTRDMIRASVIGVEQSVGSIQSDGVGLNNISGALHGSEVAHLKLHPRANLQPSLVKSL
jgi:hypothetical protein